MSDPLLFIYGCMVTVLAGAGAFLFVYRRFREVYARENWPELRHEGERSVLGRAARPDVAEGPADAPAPGRRG